LEAEEIAGNDFTVRNTARPEHKAVCFSGLEIYLIGGQVPLESKIETLRFHGWMSWSKIVEEMDQTTLKYGDLRCPGNSLVASLIAMNPEFPDKCAKMPLAGQILDWLGAQVHCLKEFVSGGGVPFASFDLENIIDP
jgi:hypothetical protein